MRCRVSSKGQLVLPKAIRDSRGFAEGAELEIDEVPDGVLLRLVKSSRTISASKLLGCTGYHGEPKTLAQMEAAVRKGARGAR
jgi:AbrB family looped-hinge helix DNA binding protein